MTKTQSKLVEAIAFANKVITITKNLKKDAIKKGIIDTIS